MLYPITYRKRDLIDPLKCFNDFFETPFSLDLSEERKWYPSVDILEEGDHYLVKVDLPGIKQEDIKVSLEKDILTIKGERTVERKDNGDNYHLIERSSGKYQRSFQLPNRVDADKIKAEYHDGVLEISLPKQEEEKKKEIEITIN